MTHALVIGGSGMLSAAVRALARSHDTVSVLARNQSRLKRLAAASPAVSTISVDYTDTAATLEKLGDAVQKHGPISLVVCWVHSHAAELPILVADLVRPSSGNVRFFHVLGSSHSRPGSEAETLRSRFGTIPGIAYHQVILGFVMEGRSSRWLTNEEISEGVVAAIEREAPSSVVGVVEPWSMRP